jgi:hypothetical protein
LLILFLRLLLVYNFQTERSASEWKLNSLIA